MRNPVHVKGSPEGLRRYERDILMMHADFDLLYVVDHGQSRQGNWCTDTRKATTN